MTENAVCTLCHTTVIIDWEKEQYMDIMDTAAQSPPSSPPSFLRQTTFHTYPNPKVPQNLFLQIIQKPPTSDHLWQKLFQHIF